MLSAPIAGSLLFAVVVWYVCAVGAVTSSKEVLRATQLPCFLCFTQNLTGCICCLARSYGEATVPMSAVYRPLVLKTGLAYALGFLLTNASIAAMRASVAETVKSIEPVSSVLLAGMCLQEGFPRPRELVGVLLAVLGVITASNSDSSANLPGISYALLSTMCFSLRGMWSREIQEAEGEDASPAPSSAALFYRVCQISACAGLACSLFLDGLTEVLSVLGRAGVFPVLLLNGILYYLYNQASFMVLQQVPLVTHALLNVLRRLLIIVFTAVWFGDALGYTRVFGVTVAFCGFGLFVGAKRQTSRAKCSDVEATQARQPEVNVLLEPCL
eukprot:TRINITY_DN3670_c0_g1_i2.p1 TRINITY_DN3670_c0_g1~~TRINITY_DN3670_c0_g1_i2.p1  ORF type:complete len:329 (-),score=54.71 TRINITY_DN3670_c0_g1_i2:414-1400(-)